MNESVNGAFYFISSEGQKRTISRRYDCDSSNTRTQYTLFEFILTSSVCQGVIKLVIIFIGFPSMFVVCVLF